jgi:hypothetical protein
VAFGTSTARVETASLIDLSAIVNDVRVVGQDVPLLTLVDFSTPFNAQLCPPMLSSHDRVDSAAVENHRSLEEPVMSPVQSRCSFIRRSRGQTIGGAPLGLTFSSSASRPTPLTDDSSPRQTAQIETTDDKIAPASLTRSFSSTVALPPIDAEEADVEESPKPDGTENSPGFPRDRETLRETSRSLGLDTLATVTAPASPERGQLAPPDHESIEAPSHGEGEVHRVTSSFLPEAIESNGEVTTDNSSASTSATGSPLVATGPEEQQQPHLRDNILAPDRQVRESGELGTTPPNGDEETKEDSVC